jgi:hypoxanthine phosphoribosyltransferase
MKPNEESSLRVRYSPKDIEGRVTDLAQKVSQDYPDSPLVIVALLKGSAFFLADLSRRITTPHTFEFITVTRRDSGGSESVEIDFSTPLSIAGKDVLVLKDVVNTGVIETYLMNQLRTDGPKSIRFAAVVDKPQERRSSILVDYVLFTSNDSEILVGYGLEYGGHFSHLPYIASLEPARGQ